MPSGQWIYTSQMGWIWAPYGREYTHVNETGDSAFQYVYYPAYGWRWYPAPWVLGWGPRPYWGPLGYSRFVWYAHPWFHPGVYRPALWGRWRRAYAVRPVIRPVYGHHRPAGRWHR